MSNIIKNELIFVWFGGVFNFNQIKKAQQWSKGAIAGPKWGEGTKSQAAARQENWVGISKT